MGRVSTPLVVGHRGAPAVAPENTLASFRAAFDAGARWVETDVHLSADGVPFLLHDDSLARTTNAADAGVDAEADVESLPWSQIRRVDAGARRGAAFAGERVPHLDELGALLQATGGSLDLEVKAPSRPAAQVVAALGETLSSQVWHDVVAQGRIVVTSFDPFVVAESLEVLAPMGVPIGLLVEDVPDADDLAELAASGVAVLATNHVTLTEEGALAVGRAGLRLWVYTANRPEDWARLTRLGVEAVCTDNPAAMLAFLRA